jgi:hypothetical protein
VTASPIISSALLHLAVAALICCFAPTGAPKLPMPQIYVDLASIPTTPDAQPALQQPAIEKPAELREASQPEVGDAEEASEAPVREVAAAVAVAPIAAVPALPEPPVSPEISQAFARASYVQAGMFRSRSYSDVATMAIKKMVERTLTTEERQQLEGEKAEVLASYAGGAGSGYAVTAENEALRRRLNDAAAWEQVPAPGSYQLPYRKVTFLVSLSRGTVRVALLPR